MQTRWKLPLLGLALRRSPRQLSRRNRISARRTRRRSTTGFEQGEPAAVRQIRLRRDEEDRRRTQGAGARRRPDRLRSSRASSRLSIRSARRSRPGVSVVGGWDPSLTESVKKVHRGGRSDRRRRRRSAELRPARLHRHELDRDRRGAGEKDDGGAAERRQDRHDLDHQRQQHARGRRRLHSLY